MKKNTRRPIPVLLLCAVVFSLYLSGCCASAEETAEAAPYMGTAGSASDYFIPVAESVDTFETMTVPCYIGDIDTAGEIEIGVLNGMTDIPYLSLETLAGLMTDTYKAYDDASSGTYQLEVGAVTDDGTVFSMVRENGSTMIVDFNSGLITFDDLALFTADPTAINGLDVVSTTKSGDKTLISHDQGFYRGGSPIIVELEHYGILPVLHEGKGYLPLQTCADLIFDRIGLLLLWDSREVMVGSGFTSPAAPEEAEEIEEAEASEEIEEEAEASDAEAPAETAASEEEAAAEPEQTLNDLFYTAPKQAKSAELTLFTYNELCLGLDYNYGLQSEHGITSFNEMFLQSDLTEKLHSTDAGDVYLALSLLCSRYFADMHSGANAISWMTDADPYSYDLENAQMTLDTGNYLNSYFYSTAREAYYPDGPVGYEEVDDTAYITFDTFYFDSDRDYYNTEITNNANDTFELIIYANRQITRENSPIRNIVVDLSNNAGGYADAAICVLSWMLNGANISIVDPISGAQSTNMFNFDANLDGNCSPVSMDGLYYGTYNLFCIISPNSFSCGNLVPCMLEDSGRVTLIGRASNGGACVVESMSTADGNIFQISGPKRISSVYNGSYYSVDTGVEPDIYITNLSHLYDRAYLTDLVHNLP